MISNKKKTFGNVREEVFENVLEIFEKLSDKPSEIFKTFSEGFKNVRRETGRLFLPLSFSYLYCKR